jgi:hypothetical protein
MRKVLIIQQYMESLPVPCVPSKIYAGISGPRGRYSPFGKEYNDGLLTVKETLLQNVPVQKVPTLHTFTKNSTVGTQDILRIARSYATSEGEWKRSL